MARWFFGELSPNEKRRNPIQGQFFVDDNDGSEARMLVREGLQNSLDAKAPGEPGPVRVRICLSGEERAAKWGEVAWIFDDVWPHYLAEGNGLSEEFRHSNNLKRSCRYLVFEDFGTTGLTGDVDASGVPESGEENAFHYFMKAEGESGKSGSDRGRWGLGKFVFPKASMIRSFLAVTRRKDEDDSLLVGQYVLKCHQIDGKHYSPDGWFGEKNGEGVWVPSRNKEVTGRVSQIFDLERVSEPGLSIIVPWCQADIEARDLLIAVVRDFYLPVLKNELVVEIVSPSESWTVDYHEFPGFFEMTRESIDDEAGAIQLAMEAVSRLGGVDYRLERPTGRPTPDAYVSSIKNEELEEIRSRDHNEEILSFRVPVSIERKYGESPAEFAEFRVWIRRNPENNARKPTFAREGLVISEATRTRLRTHDVLVVIDQGAFSKILGDAENPAHTNWNARSENFKDKYKYGPSLISLVKNMPGALVQLILGEENKKDVKTLQDLFPLPAKAPARERPTSPKPPTPPDSSRLDSWKFHAIHNGVVISGNTAAEKPVWPELIIRLAYDREQGNPATHWKPEDFVLDEEVDVIVDGDDLVDFVISPGNTISVKTNGPKYRIEISGFDPNRDLWFEVREEGI